MHLPVGSVEAHRDLHFRLLRYNLVADIQESITGFRQRGGLQGLKQQVHKQYVNETFTWAER